MANPPQAQQKKGGALKGFLALVVVLGLIIVPITIYKSGKVTGDPCDSGLGCPWFNMCLDGYCYEHCDVDDDCPKGSYCSNSFYMMYENGTLVTDKDDKPMLCNPPLDGPSRAELKEQSGASDEGEAKKTESAKKASTSSSTGGSAARNEAAQDDLAKIQSDLADDLAKSQADLDEKLAKNKADLEAKLAKNQADLEVKLAKIKYDGAWKITQSKAKLAKLTVDEKMFQDAYAQIADDIKKKENVMKLAEMVIAIIQKDAGGGHDAPPAAPPSGGR